MDAPPSSASIAARQLLLGMRATLAVLQQTHPEIDARMNLKESDYTATNAVSIETGPAGAPFRLVDMAPLPFAILRTRFGIRQPDFAHTLADEHVKERGSVGKSGSMFVTTADQSVILKTLRKEEAETLIKFLPAYLDHIRNEPDSLLNRFLGLYKLKTSKDRSTFFVAMTSCLNAPLELDEVYDIKGSTQGRQETTGAERAKGKVYKDLDFVSGLQLGPRNRDMLLAQLKRDIDLLQGSNLMDYSLLIGIKRAAPEPAKLSSLPSARGIIYRSAFTRDQGGFRASDAADQPLTEIYYLGVIDVLQDYNVKKQLAHGWKSIQVEEERLSTVEPAHYATRFLSFVGGKIVGRPSEPRSRERAPTEQAGAPAPMLPPAKDDKGAAPAAGEAKVEEPAKDKEEPAEAKGEKQAKQKRKHKKKDDADT